MRGPGLQPRSQVVSSLLLTLVLALWPVAGWTGNELAREILQELVEIPTTPTSGKIPEAAAAMAARLLAAGFPAADVRVLGFEPELANLVVRCRGAGDDHGEPCSGYSRRGCAGSVRRG